MEITPSTNGVKNKKFMLKESISYNASSITSKMIVKGENGNVTLFSFAEGEGLSPHSAPYDVFIHVLEGSADIKIGEKMNNLSAGEAIIMPANVPHSVSAKAKFKMLLVMIRG